MCVTGGGFAVQDLHFKDNLLAQFKRKVKSKHPGKCRRASGSGIRSLTLFRLSNADSPSLCNWLEGEW